jgi:hypothetical protein
MLVGDGVPAVADPADERDDIDDEQRALPEPLREQERRRRRERGASGLFKVRPL